MKTRRHKFWLISLLACWATMLFSCADEPRSVQFYTGSWQGLLAEAKKQNRPIFIDVQTTWCGSCRMMEKQAFPDPAVGKKLNANFVNYSVDMEKHDVGPALRKKFAITAVPTLLFLSPGGELVYRTVGYDDKDGVKMLLGHIDKALDATGEVSQLASLEEQYSNGQRGIAFLRMYLSARARMGVPNEEAMEAFIRQVPQREWTQTHNLALITKNTITHKSPSFDHLLRFADSIRADRAQRNAVWLVVKAVDRVKSNELAEAKTEADVDRIIGFDHKIGDILSTNRMDAQQKTYWANKIRGQFYQRTKNQTGYRPIALAEANRLMAMPPDSLKYVDEKAVRITRPAGYSPEAARKASAQGYYGRQSAWAAGELNKLVRAHMDVMTSEADLRQALTWSTRSLTLFRYSEFLDNHAQLLARLNRKKEAIAVEQEAITKAKAADQDVVAYERRLAELRKK